MTHHFTHGASLKSVRLTFTGLVSAFALTGCLTLPGLGVGVTGGTTGLGVEAKANPLPTGHVMIRGGVSYLDVGGDFDSDGVTYDGDVEVANLNAVLDFSPTGGLFYISGGAYFGDKTVDLVATPMNNVDVGGVTFTPGEVGSLVGEVEYSDVSPYLGIAFDNFTNSVAGWSFNARAGVMFVGSPDITVNSVGGTLSSDAALLNALNAEIDSLEEDAEDYEFFPVVTLGVTRRF